MTGKARIFFAAVLMAAWASGAAWAQEQEPPRPNIETVREYQRLAQEVQQLFAEKKYEEVLPKCRRMAELLPKETVPDYNLACAQALLGKPEEAFTSLAASVEKGFDDPAHMKQDPDLESLRGDKRFDALVEKTRENEKKAGGRYEPGIDIPGVRTVEDFPEGGLRYRLRMNPDAGPEKPDRLLVWLHPAGGSMNDIVEQLAPRFLAKRFALVVFTQKSFRYWSAADITRLSTRTLPALAKVAGLDASKPVLMGYSAGGQAALLLWEGKPGDFAGLVLDAAYPVRPVGLGQYAAIELPGDEAVKQVPLFVVVGENDGGSRFWRRLEPVWQKAGVPLTVLYVPDKGHTWLFGNFQLAALDAWLADVAAGKIPRPPVAQAPPEEQNDDPNAKPEPPEFKD